MTKKVPGSREEDIWLTEEDLTRCDRADTLDPLRSPVPTRMISNGEFLPIPQTEEQKRVEARVLELAATGAKKLGIGRRRFLASSGGMAAAFVAMNEVFGRFFDVDPTDVFSSAAAAERGVPKDVFVFDAQLHLARGNFNQTLLYGLRSVAEGPSSGVFPVNPFNPTGLPDESGSPWGVWNPNLVGLPLTPESFSVTEFIKMVFFDSQVTAGVVTGAPGSVVTGAPGTPQPTIEALTASEVLTAQQACAVRDFVNGLAGSQRLFAHGRMYPGVGNLDWIRHQSEVFKPDSWKGYMSATAKLDNDPLSPLRLWRMDDEVVDYPTYEVITEYQKKYRKERPGWGNICVHKTPPSADAPAEVGSPIDLPKASTDWPNLNFIIYHSCFKLTFFNYAEFQSIVAENNLRNGVPDIPATTLFAQLCGGRKNVYAEIGATFGSTVVTFPTVWAHIIGQLLKYMGEDNIIFGTDCVWFGDPQWQIEAFWRFQIPEDIREKWGYPKITEAMKRKILGLNSARLYGMHPAAGNAKGAWGSVPADYASRMSLEFKTVMEFPGYVADNMQRLRDEYLASGGFSSNIPLGWVRTKV
jgi:hypothetical protein